MLDSGFLLDLALRMPVVLMALTVHEFSHAYFALRMGDPTAYRMGRCTLNPLAHLDPLGTLCLLFAPIGWAKPVPVNPLNFHDPRRGSLVTSVAGPLSNLAQAVVFALLLRGLIHVADMRADTISPAILKVIETATVLCGLAVLINVGLAIFNLLPLYPLDGFHVTLQLMKPSQQQWFLQTAPIGPFAVLGVVMIGRFGNVDILGRLIEPPVRFIFRYVAGVSLY